MGDRLTLAIGGLGLTLHCADPSFLAQAADRYEGFVAGSQTALDAHYHLRLAVSPRLSPGSETIPSVHRTGSGYRLRRRDFEACLEGNEVRGHVAPSPYSLDSFLRVLLSVALLDHDGLLIHASSAADGDRGFVFFGVSGAGKTTTARLSAPERTLFSDEISLVRRMDGRYQAFGTPFWGMLQKNGANARAPLAALLALVQSPRVALEPLSAAAALRRLMPCILFFSHDDALVRRVTDLAVGLVSAVPSHAMHFRPDNSFWRLLTDAGGHCNRT